MMSWLAMVKTADGNAVGVRQSADDPNEMTVADIETWAYYQAADPETQYFHYNNEPHWFLVDRDDVPALIELLQAVLAAEEKKSSSDADVLAALEIE